MAKAIYKRPGEVVDYTNSGETAIAAGDIVSLTTRVGVAASAIPAGEWGSVSVVGVYEFPKGSVVISQGDAVYFSTSTGKITKTNTDVPAGWAVAGALQAAETVLVKIG